MGLTAQLKSTIKAARKRRALWVRILDLARLVRSAEGRSVLWTRTIHRQEVHQTTPYTCVDRYPALFNLAASLAPDANRILSFGCSTGEELIALRLRFPNAEIVGCEINPRSRRIAVARVRNDPRTSVVRPHLVQGKFDVVFALAVLQREPHNIAQMVVSDLTPYYPYDRFNSMVSHLLGALRQGGLFCVINAQYRLEDSSVGQQIEPISGSDLLQEPLFGKDGLLLRDTHTHTIFRKRSQESAGPL